MKESTAVNDTRFTKTAIKKLGKEWNKYMQSIPAYPAIYEGKGIVLCAGGITYFTCAWIALKAIRRSGCTLPIQLWHIGNELSDEVIRELTAMDVECKNFLDYKDPPAKGFALKPFAILHSRFKEVLCIDADNVCASNPEALFYTEVYRLHAALFWPGFRKPDPSNAIWEITGTGAFDTWEQDSGQLLINKELCWKELQLCLFFNQHSEVYYKMTPGGKDTFQFAWLALKRPSPIVATAAGICGYVHPVVNKFMGTTTVQHDPAGNIAFLHRQLLQWDKTNPEEPTWQIIKRFTNHDNQNEFQVHHDPACCHAFMDLTGAVESIPFNKVFNNLENSCLADLKELQGSKMYARFLVHAHFTKHRYRPDIPFSATSLQPIL